MDHQPANTAKLTSTPTETEAAIVIEALGENGIRAESDEYTSGLRAGAWNWVDIMVAEGDFERTKEVLAQVQRENAHIDWSKVDVGKPEAEQARLVDSLMARDDENLARLTSVKTEAEAGIIVSGLEARGIQATMSGVYTANFRAEAPGWVEVLVAEQDLPRSQDVLEEVRGEHGDVDWSQVDVGEPEDEHGSNSVPWWMGLVFWRRIAVVLIAIDLAYEFCVFAVAAMVRMWSAVSG